MEYRGSYGKVVKVNLQEDGEGKPVETEFDHVVTQYICSDDQLVGVYPIYPEYGVEDTLSMQPVAHIVFASDLTEVEGK